MKSVFETSVEINGEPAKNPIGIEKAKEEIAKMLDSLMPEQRKRVINNLSRQFKSEMARYQSDLDSKISKRDALAHKLKVAEAICSWADSPVKLERNDCSRFHKLCDAAKKGTIHILSPEGEIDTMGSYEQITEHYSHVFVVKHDWAGGFGDSIGNVLSEEWRLPYDLCAFEFLISGRPVVVLAIQDGTTSKAVAFICVDDSWATLGHVKANENPHLLFAWDQVRAICIALDAEIAVSTVERAPVQLNEKRIKAGKVPLSDYHVVDLARRHRVSNAAMGVPGTRKRLHFRRGHWRHYETHNTWIRWTLVGNPDLGFVASEYSL
jgi:hypothetical protein